MPALATVGRYHDLSVATSSINFITRSRKKLASNAQRQILPQRENLLRWETLSGVFPVENKQPSLVYILGRFHSVIEGCCFNQHIALGQAILASLLPKTHESSHNSPQNARPLELNACHHKMQYSFTSQSRQTFDILHPFRPHPPHTTKSSTVYGILRSSLLEAQISRPTGWLLQIKSLSHSQQHFAVFGRPGKPKRNLGTPESPACCYDIWWYLMISYDILWYLIWFWFTIIRTGKMFAIDWSSQFVTFEYIGWRFRSCNPRSPRSRSFEQHLS